MEKSNNTPIEELILNSIEGLLTPDEEAALQLYLLQHADAARLYDEYKRTVLIDTDKISFPFKEELYRSPVNKNTIEEYIIGKIEGLLTADETAAVDAYIRVNPDAQKWLTAYRHTLLEPETIIYPYKDSLLRQGSPLLPVLGGVTKVMLFRAAAILALALTILAGWRWLLPANPEASSNTLARVTSPSHTGALPAVPAPTIIPKISITPATSNALAGVAHTHAAYTRRTPQPVTPASPVNTNFDPDTRALLAAGKAYGQSGETFAVYAAAPAHEPRACLTLDCMEQAQNASLFDNSYTYNPPIFIRPYSHNNNYALNAAAFGQNKDRSHNPPTQAQGLSHVFKQLSHKVNMDSTTALSHITAIHISYNSPHFRFSKTIKLK